MDVRLPDGTLIQGVPDNITKAELTAKLARNGYDVSKLKSNPQLDGVPGQPGDVMGNRNVGQPSAGRSIGERIEGGIETAMTLATGATGGTLGMVGGTVKGLAGAVMDGTFGTQAGVRQVEQSAANGMQALTYAPRTEAGQEYAGKVGEVLAETIPAMGLTSEMAAIGRGASQVGKAARGYAAATNASLNAADAALAAAPKAPLRDLVRKPVASMSGVGAAETRKAAIRAERFDRFGIKPTEGQLTRDPVQIKFEREIAKTEEGKAAADRFAEQNVQVERVLSGLEEETGALIADPYDKGKAIVEAVETKAAAKKAEANVAYTEARAAGEMMEPVDITPVLTFVKANKGKDKMAPIISMIESEIKQNGKEVGGGLDKLTLNPTPKRIMMTLDAAEDLRQAINDLAEPGTPNMPIGIKVKQLLDKATEEKGGEKYKVARKKWADYSKEFTDRDAINSLLRTKPGRTDRVVPFEQTFDHLIIKGNRDSVKHVFKVLDDTPAGQQAAAELRGALVSHIRDKVFSNGGADKLGNVVGSQKKILDVVTQLDRKGVLEAALGKDGARAIRDLRDLAVDIYTEPGVVNRSNNENAIVAALDKIHNTSGFLPGAGYVTKHVRDHVKSRVIAKKIEKALNPGHKSGDSTPTPPRSRPAGAPLH